MFPLWKKWLLGTLILGLMSCSAQEQNQVKESPAKDSAMRHVAVTTIVEHPALDSVRYGMIEVLNEAGFQEGKNIKITFQSAQSNTATAGQIAKQFVGDNPDVIVAIATPSAQSVAAATNTIPVVFSAVTDPVAAKLVPSMEASGGNVTGASDALPIDPQIELMQKLLPNLKQVGYVYSPGEVNSTVVLKELQEKLAAKGIEVVPAPAQRTTDIPMATRSLKGRVQLVYTALDNNVASAYESMYQAAKESQLPLMASDVDLVSRGAVAALGVNYHDLGRETGQVVLRILNGEKPGDISIATMQKLDLYISPKHAEEEGLTLPESLIKEADKIIEDNAKEAQ